MSDCTNIWLHCPFSKPDTEYRLICFPHAGGTASFFQSWSSKLTNIKVCSIRYPGRGERIDEAQPEDLRLLSKDIAQALQPLTELPLLFFGHSMGAVVALETTRELENKGIRIAHLFASGSRNGSCPPRYVQSEEDDETLCNQLIKIGGTDTNAVKDPIFLELVLPSIRADGKMFHSYEMDIEPKLQCPVTTIFGLEDNDADIRPWHELAPNGFTEQCVPGGHFYLISEPPFSIIKNVLNQFIINEEQKTPILCSKKD